MSADTLLRKFLAEDAGGGDATSRLLPRRSISGKIVAREPGMAAGTRYAKRIFEIKGCRCEIRVPDGSWFKRNDTIAEVSGVAYNVLLCERTALNLMSRMCGIATLTAHAVSRIPKTVGLYATRKTAPGLRLFDKEAVETGGGYKHRMSLGDSILVKDNHLAVDGLESIIRKAKSRRVSVEAESIQDAVRAARLGASVILLDNMAPAQIRRTVRELERTGLRDRVRIEVSGGIGLQNIARYANLGIDMISMGSLTHSVREIDLALDI